jgi:hypothetical protein
MEQPSTPESGRPLEPPPAGSPPVAPPPPVDGQAGQAAKTPTPPAAPVVDPKAARRDTVPSGSNVAQKFKSIVDSQVTVVGTQVDHHQMISIENALFDQEIGVRPFSIKMAIPIPAEDDASADVVYDDTLVERALAGLRDSRILVISGQSGCGKGALSRLLAARLRQDDANIHGETWVVPALDARVRVNLPHHLQIETTLDNRVLIFHDALARANANVREFLMLLRGDTARSLAVLLRRKHLYLLITADSDTLTRELQLFAPGLHLAVEPLSADLVLKGLAWRADALFRSQAVSDDLIRRFDPALRDRIVECGKNLARIGHFVETALLRVLKQEWTVEDGFERLDALAWRLQDEPGEQDLESWLFSVALVMTHVDEKAGVPWSDFLTVYEAIRTHALAWRAAPGEGEKSSALPRALVDEHMVAAAQAVVVRDPVLPRDVITFQYEYRANRLWERLLRHARTFVSSLIPVFRALAEHETASVRRLSARILGRIGIMDAPAITYALMDRWSTEEAYGTRALVGHALSGVWATGDRFYRDASLKQLDDRLARLDDRPSGSADHTRELWTAIAAYKQMGSVDLPLALGRLRRVAEQHLASRFEEAAEMGRAINELVRMLEALPAEEVQSAGLDQSLRVLLRFYRWSFQRDEEIAVSLQYALVSLCMSNEPIAVLSELRRWMSGSPGLRMLLVMIFLQQKGIACELSRRTLNVDCVRADGSSFTAACTPLVVATASGEAAVRVLADLIEDVYSSCHELFGLASSSLDRMLLEHIKAWAASSAAAPVCRVAMEQLLAALLTSLNKSLATQILDWLNTESSFATGELKRMSDNARMQAIVGR